jgi:hypothetical protein
VPTQPEYAAWFTALIKDDLVSATQVAQAVVAPREEGPMLGRPPADRIQGGRIHHLKELRPGSGGRSDHLAAGTSLVKSGFPGLVRLGRRSC